MLGKLEFIIWQAMNTANKSSNYEAPTPSGAYIMDQGPQFVVQRPPRRQGVEWIHIKEWEVGICGCCSNCVPNCCMSTFCPCISLAQIAARLDVIPFELTLLLYLIIQLSFWGLYGMAMYELYSAYYDAYLEETEGYHYYYYHDDDDDGNFFDAFESVEIDPKFTLYTILASSTYLLIVMFVWHLRARTRDRFVIPGNCCADCFASLCCTCCAIAQIATHVKSYKPGHCDFGPRDVLPAYAHGHISRNVNDAA